MHERAYRLLLRLYPAQFRRSHGEEALQLFRDRLHDETGFLRRVRLWVDLLGDFGATRLRGYRELPVAAAVTASGPGPGAPLFAILEDERLRAGPVLWGGVASIVLCASVVIALEHGGRYTLFKNEVAYTSTGVTKSRVRIEFECRALDTAKNPTVRMKAVVQPLSGGPMPTGTITFDYGWKTVATGVLVDGTVVVDAKLPDNKGHTMDALYLGDANYSIARSVGVTP
jgi:hypothetical protein